MLRNAMTLLELLVVILIVGVVYTFGTFALTKSTSSSRTTLNSLIPSLEALSGGKTITLTCQSDCVTCSASINGSDKPISITLYESNPISVHVFDPNGDIEVARPILTKQQGVLKEGCFSYTIHSDGTASSLLLKSGGSYYAYRPLSKQPIVTQSVEELRDTLYPSYNYPLLSDDYYAAH